MTDAELIQKEPREFKAMLVTAITAAAEAKQTAIEDRVTLIATLEFLRDKGLMTDDDMRGIIERAHGLTTHGPPPSTAN